MVNMMNAMFEAFIYLEFRFFSLRAVRAFSKVRARTPVQQQKAYLMSSARILIARGPPGHGLPL